MTLGGHLYNKSVEGTFDYIKMASRDIRRWTSLLPQFLLLLEAGGILYVTVFEHSSDQTREEVKTQLETALSCAGLVIDNVLIHEQAPPAVM